MVCIEIGFDTLCFGIMSSSKLHCEERKIGTDNDMNSELNNDSAELIDEDESARLREKLNIHLKWQERLA
jgi:hypothetical protein